MNTYLVVCGIIFNVLVLLVIVGGVISGINTRKINKMRAAEEAQKRIQYKEELKEAEKAWQEWVKKYDELKQSWNKETDQFKRMLLHLKCDRHSWERYYFNSTEKSAYLLDLGEENNWVRQEQPPKLKQ